MKKGWIKPKRDYRNYPVVKAKPRIPFLDVEGIWEADKNEQSAAWEPYVEGAVC